MSLNNSEKNITMTLLMASDLLSTRDLPQTHEILNAYFPKVLNTECYNDLNLPFHEEVRNTEIGHLFEHIMLSFLCELKMKSGCTKASFKGVTEWNWKKDTKGTFHIKIDITSEDIIYIQEAYESSHQILQLILKDSSTSKSSIN